MTSTIHRPTATGFPDNDPEQRAMQATNRCITNLTNEEVRTRRQLLASQEQLAAQGDRNAQRCDQGHGQILAMQDEISTQIDETTRELASRQGLERLEKMLKRIESRLDQGVFIDKKEPDVYLEAIQD